MPTIPMKSSGMPVSRRPAVTPARTRGDHHPNNQRLPEAPKQNDNHQHHGQESAGYCRGEVFLGLGGVAVNIKQPIFFHPPFQAILFFSRYFPTAYGENLSSRHSSSLFWTTAIAVIEFLKKQIPAHHIQASRHGSGTVFLNRIKVLLR
jgi:hypothetical protein